MELTHLLLIAGRELREALRNRWMWLYALAFAGLALALSQAGLAAAGYAGLGGFGRTAASLVNALLLFVPLMALSVGASALAGDRERGTLLFLLAQPVTRAEVFWGKVMGAALALTAALALGFGAAGLALAAGGSAGVSAYARLAGFTLLLALACLGLGFVISSLTRKSATAAGGAILVWLGLVFFSDLGLAGLTLVLRPAPRALLAMLMGNPLQVFKLGAIHSLHATLDTLGAVGQFALYRFGDGLPWVLVVVLAAWSAITFTVAFKLFERKVDA
jgi:Cu-processing system permease protein